jgi:hypothetical protein
LVGPYQRNADVLQHATPTNASAHKHAANASMMRAIAADEVIEASLARLEKPGITRSSARNRA